MKSNFVCCGSFAWWLKTTSVTFMVLHLLHVSTGLQATHALYLAAVTLLLLALDFLDVFLDCSIWHWVVYGHSVAELEARSSFYIALDIKHFVSSTFRLLPKINYWWTVHLRVSIWLNGMIQNSLKSVVAYYKEVMEITWQSSRRWDQICQIIWDNRVAGLGMVATEELTWLQHPFTCLGRTDFLFLISKDEMLCRCHVSILFFW